MDAIKQPLNKLALLYCYINYNINFDKVIDEFSKLNRNK